MSASTLAMAGTSRTLSHLYDGNGNRTRITHPDGSFFPYEYDGLGRFLRISENGGDTLAISIYDNAGRRSRSGWAAATDYTYDPVGRLQSMSHDMAGSSGDHVIGLAYNPASQIASRSGSNDIYVFAGPAAGRRYTVNGLNQYTAAGPAAFTYDANGNLTSTASPDGTTSFVYDAENRLMSASGSHTASLVYDPLGRLFQVSGGPAGITQFLYDDDALIGEYDSAGGMPHRYLHGPAKGVDDPIIWYHNSAAGWRQALVSDQQGSIIAVADMYGNRIATNAYDEWGLSRAAQAGSAALTSHGRFQYTGQAWIPELGLYYYKARFYSPTLGRFLQTDPIGYDDQVNLYAYVGNDPVNGIDSSGERWEVTWHQVAPSWLSTARHTAIRFTPDNQDAVKNNPLFRNVDSEGNRYMTFSAGPSANSLVSAVNRTSDLGPQEGAVAIPVPKGTNEFKIFNRIATADRAYKDELDYDLHPARAGQGSTFVADDGYNSNSYVSGILNSVGITPPKITQVPLPGYGKPVPKECFAERNSCN